MKKFFLLLLFGLFFFQGVSSQTYIKTEFYNTTLDKIYVGKAIPENVIGEPLNITNFGFSGQVGSFLIKNSLKYDLSLNVTYQKGNNIIEKKSLTILSGGEGKVTGDCCAYGLTGGCRYIADCYIVESSVSYDIYEPFQMKLGEIVQENQRIVPWNNCTTSNYICLNDGSSCSFSSECGGNYCVSGICNKEPVCIGNPPNCNCKNNEVQCNDNVCIKKDSKIVGELPVCNIQECVTNLTNSTTGVCITVPIIPKTPWENFEIVFKNFKSIFQESLKLISLTLSLLGVVILLLFGRITRIRESNSGSFWYWRNPKFIFYPCFVNKNKKNQKIKKSNDLVHVWIAKKYIYNKYINYFRKKYPSKELKDLHIHHIDKNVMNWNKKNLIILSKEEHKKLDHSNIEKGNWELGIKELKKHKYSNPHLEDNIKTKKR